MEVTLLVNVGLNTSSGGTVPADFARKVLAHYGFEVTRYAVLTSDTEPTLVASVNKAYVWTNTVYLLTRVAEDLDQDCIAAYSEAAGKGKLIGPRAAKWGEFNPEYFFLLDGTRLGQQFSQAA